MMTDTNDETQRVIGGVDTHKDVHVAAVLDELGRLLATASFATTVVGYRQLHRWLCGHGEVFAVGVEGTGSWGAGLSRFLRARGLNVVEVNRPNRQVRRRKGKSDTVDAEMAARAVLAGDATVTPKAADGPVEALRQLRLARAGAIKARTAAANQLHSLTDTAPDDLRARLRSLTTLQRARTCARFRAGDVLTPAGAAKRALRSIATRWLALHDEIMRALRRDQAHPRHDRSSIARASRHRLRNDRHTALRGWRQPRTARHRSRLRRTVRHRTRARVIRQNQPPSPQPRRRPPSQLRALDNRDGPHPQQSPAHHRLHQTTNSRRAQQTRNHPMPQALRRTRDLQRHTNNHRTPPTTPNRRLTPRGASDLASASRLRLPPTELVGNAVHAAIGKHKRWLNANLDERVGRDLEPERRTPFPPRHGDYLVDARGDRQVKGFTVAESTCFLAIDDNA